MRELKYFAGYFHQDYDVISGTADDVVADFKRDETAATVQQLIPEIQMLLASPLTEPEIDDLWGNSWRAVYEPRDDGMTYREWFAHVLNLLQSSTPG